MKTKEIKKKICLIDAQELILLRSQLRLRYEEVRANNEKRYKNTKKEIPTTTYRDAYIDLRYMIKKETGAEIGTSVLTKIFDEKKSEIKIMDENLEDLYLFFSGFTREGYRDVITYKYEEYISSKTLSINFDTLQLKMQRTSERLLVVHANGMQYINLSYSTTLLMHNFNIDVFKVLEKPKDLEVTYKFVVNPKTPTQKIIWRVLFSRTLKAKEQVRFLFTVSYDNAHSFTKEDMAKAKSEGRLAEKTTGGEIGMIAAIARDVKKAKIFLHYPNNYPIIIKSPVVKKNGIRREYIEKLCKVIIEKNETQTTCELVLPNVLHDLNYNLVWYPPTIAQLLEQNVITEQQAQVIRERTKIE